MYSAVWVFALLAAIAFSPGSPRSCGTMPESSNLKTVYKPNQIPETTNLLTTTAGGTPIGQIATSSSSSNCPYLKPVVDLYSSFFRSHYYTVDEMIINLREGQGWTNQGILGYAVPTAGLCGANDVIYSFFRNNRGFVQVTNGSNLYQYALSGAFVFSGRPWAMWQ
ncbi:unnamed protein product [Soboliphyme baturini]|uniref:Peptidase A1 domain-containing protein n=1 Tax=Soboliphyme baturini TaxID=241478 RepID=A0A183JA25_9BILA|nr:unnamed protein product [Soboliphyme baturini]